MNLDPILFPLFVFWGLGLVLLLFRRGPAPAYRISAVLIFAFYLIWFYEPTLASYAAYRDSFQKTVPAFLSTSKNLLALCLLLLWGPVAFIVFLYGSPEQSGSVLRAMVLLTLFFWLFWFLNYFLAPWPEEMLKSVLPRDFTIPKLPDPPTRAQ